MANKRIPKSQEEVRELILEVVRTLAALLEEKDPFLKKHSERVANNSANFCEEYQVVAAEDVETIYFAGLLHDIGIVAIPKDILHQTDPLSDTEMVRIKKHPISGEKILSNFSYLNGILPVVRHHHEAFDGSGYPDGIEGEKIPLGARIVALFNRFDNLVFPRFSEKKISLEDALQTINDEAGQLFDSQLVDNFLVFAEATAGDSEDYLLKQETASMKQILTGILHKFQSGKLKPPVMSQVVREIRAVIKRPKSTSEEIAQAIEKDPVISLRLISVANSPIYRGVSQIQDVKSALPRLGLKETLSIVLAIANKDLYTTDKVQYKLLMDQMWVHSLATGYSAKLIAQKLKIADPENFFLMGLTHDVGKILLLKAFTDVSKQRDLNLMAVTAIIQEAHLSLGSLLLKRWKFDDVYINVLIHHEDEELSDNTEKEILVVHLANMLTRNIGFSLHNEEVNFAALESALILKIKAVALEEIAENVKEIMSDVAHLF